MPKLPSDQRPVNLRLGILWERGSLSEGLRANLKTMLYALSTGDARAEVVALTDRETAIDSHLRESSHVRLLPRPHEWSWLRAVCGWWVRWSRRFERWSKAGEAATEEAHFRLAESLRHCSPVLALLVLLLVWPAVAAYRLLGALLWGLGFPLWMTDRVIRRIEFALRRRAQEQILAADCDVWLVPYPNRWELSDVPAVLLLDRADQLSDHLLPPPEPKLTAPWEPEPPPCLVMTLDGSRPWAWRQRWLGMSADQFHSAPDGRAEAWLGLFDAALLRTPRRRGFDSELLAPWPENVTVRTRPDRPLEAFLFLQVPWGGGNWEHTRELVAALAKINDQERRLRLTLGVHLTQPNAWTLDALETSIPVQRLMFNAISRTEAAGLEPAALHWLDGHPAAHFAFFSGAAEAALRADAWLALSDRFPLPLLPARPYGVVVHDMIHLHVPEALGRAHFRNLVDGVKPTIDRAERIIVTSPCTRDDVLAAYQLPADKVEQIPVACEPHARFGRLPTGFVPLPRRDFILNVTNASPHKGVDLMLRAHAALKRRLGEATPLLVVCGINTEHLAASRGRTTLAFWDHVRTLQVELGLRENQDVVFLGAVTDVELKDLYQRCRAVVNAARHDNGTYCMIEGVWFGKPVISTRYPAAEFLAERFGLPARFVPLDDPEALANALAEGLRQAPADADHLAHLRRHLAAPEFSVHHYAARLYDILVELALQGRQQSLTRVPRVDGPECPRPSHLSRLGRQPVRTGGG